MVSELLMTKDLLGLETSRCVLCRHGKGTVGDIVLFKQDDTYLVGELKMCLMLGGGEQKAIVSCCLMTPHKDAADTSCIRRFESTGTDRMIRADSLISPLYYMMHAVSGAFHAIIPMHYVSLMR